MENVFGFLLAVLVLGTMAIVLWFVKWYVIGGLLVIAVIEVLYQKVTGKKSRFMEWCEKR